jgi:hypothetical protein
VLRADLQKTQNDILDMTRLPADLKISAQLRQLSTLVSDLKSREEKLEQIIIANPSKALEIPLIQRDIQSIKSVQDASIAAAKEEIDRIYDMNKTILIGTGLSIISLAIATFFKPSKPSTDA